MLSAVTTQPQTQLCDLQPIQTISLTSSVATTQGHLPYFLHRPSEKSHLISSLPTGKLSSTPQLAICMHMQKSAVCFISQHMVPDLWAEPSRSRVRGTLGRNQYHLIQSSMNFNVVISLKKRWNKDYTWKFIRKSKKWKARKRNT